MKVALVQMLVTKSKPENIKSAIRMIQQARRRGADMVVLPECFNSPYTLFTFAMLMLVMELSSLVSIRNKEEERHWKHFLILREMKSVGLLVDLYQRDTVIYCIIRVLSWTPLEIS